ncbi:hypothetical protein J45TS6_48580 [Paenibacillus sp. J45TS6]|nr:hypothetical protein J45TS6_48580 [Paenibacillus sp. J45TS6]
MSKRKYSFLYVEYSIMISKLLYVKDSDTSMLRISKGRLVGRERYRDVPGDSSAFSYTTFIYWH